ncbi:Alpha/Beta hydrolase protein [Pisolithus marmoratus]|nr:Alpha/Beta hydrolase protein [Pisolithus marmoratus]
MASPLAAQNFHLITSFRLESGTKLKKVSVVYKTWGAQLNATPDTNAMVICVQNCRGKAFDPQQFLVFYANVLGPPYGTSSPVTVSPDTDEPYDPLLPQATIRDDIRLHKLVLDHLGVSGIAVAIGWSMGGMAVLECYVRRIIPIVTSARHSAWCIGWGGTQRQSHHDVQPSSGLLLTYCSHDSCEKRFGRCPQIPPVSDPSATAPSLSRSTADVALVVHNEDCQKSCPKNSQSKAPGSQQSQSDDMMSSLTTPPTPPIFSAQSYLRYQGAIFVAWFDVNYYIHITRKLDTHVVARGRMVLPDDSSSAIEATAFAAVLASLPRCTLVISIETDDLFTPSEHKELATHISEAEIGVISSSNGHDGFLLEFEQINKHIHIRRCLKTEFPEYYL